MSQPFVGQIIATGFNYAPPGWFLCNGSLQPIDQYQALYSLIGTTYGGDGISTFGVPNLQSRTPLCMGQGNGLSNYVQGQSAGFENVTLQGNQLGSHNHNLMALTVAATSNTPTSTVALATGSLTQTPTYQPGAPTTALAPNAIGPSTGGNLPHPNLQPLQCLNYIMAWQGIYPQRS